MRKKLEKLVNFSLESCYNVIVNRTNKENINYDKSKRDEH